MHIRLESGLSSVVINAGWIEKMFINHLHSIRFYVLTSNILDYYLQELPAKYRQGTSGDRIATYQ